MRNIAKGIVLVACLMSTAAMAVSNRARRIARGAVAGLDMRADCRGGAGSVQAVAGTASNASRRPPFAL